MSSMPNGKLIVDAETSSTSSSPSHAPWNTSSPNSTTSAQSCGPVRRHAAKRNSIVNAPWHFSPVTSPAYKQQHYSEASNMADANNEITFSQGRVVRRNTPVHVNMYGPVKRVYHGNNRGSPLIRFHF